MLELVLDNMWMETVDYFTTKINLAKSLLPTAATEVAGTAINFAQTQDTILESTYDTKVLAATAFVGLIHPVYKCVLKPVWYTVSEGMAHLSGY